MYTDLKRSEKLLIARKFYLHLNSMYSSGTLGLPMSKWLNLFQRLNEDFDISNCIMWDTSYRSLFDILLKHYHVFEITDNNTTPYLYDIVNNKNIVLEEFNIDL
tara:strand:- start:131 stop:442 length:312 start_codon:yes stop_codon:yes gene_type:complete